RDENVGRSQRPQFMFLSLIHNTICLLPHGRRKVSRGNGKQGKRIWWQKDNRYSDKRRFSCHFIFLPFSWLRPKAAMVFLHLSWFIPYGSGCRPGWQIPLNSRVPTVPADRRNRPPENRERRRRVLRGCGCPSRRRSSGR